MKLHRVYNENRCEALKAIEREANKCGAAETQRRMIK